MIFCTCENCPHIPPEKLAAYTAYIMFAKTDEWLKDEMGEYYDQFVKWYNHIKEKNNG